MSSEKVVSNQVDVRTVFIGVGGIGSDIVRLVAEMCKPGETENVNFVCLDTNANDLRSVKNSEAKIYFVQTSTTQTVGNYLNYDKDALHNWFPMSKVMFNKTVSEGAGQVRAISRLALNATIKNGNIEPLYAAIDDLFRKDGADLKQAIRVAFVSSASGGTGSGMILPLSMIVRDYIATKYPNTGSIIRTTLLLPETLDSVITSNAEKESQRRNAYATIKEINAFMMKGTGIFDTDENLKRYKNLRIDMPTPGSDELRPISALPCDFCFLLDGQNAEDSTLVSLNQYKTQAAQALYEQNIGPMQKKAFSMEDNVIKEFANKGNYARNRFGGIGASALKYPYEEVADFVAYGWAIDSIGGEGEAAKWIRYDNKYEIEKRAAKAKGLSKADMPKRSEVYINEMRSAKDKFTKDLTTSYSLNEINRRIKLYFRDFEKEMHNSLKRDSAINSAQKQAVRFEEKQDFTQESVINESRDFVATLRTYENSVRKRADKAAQNTAEGIFSCDTKTALTNEPYTLEALMKTAGGDVFHPNAMRFVMYQVQNEMQDKLKNAERRIQAIEESLQVYSPQANNAAEFDVKATKTEENNIDSLCAAVSSAKQKKSDELFEKVNQHLMAYYDAIKEFAEKKTELQGYKVGLHFLKDMDKCMMAFYESFGDKVKMLNKRRDDLVDQLAFRKGDSTVNICSERRVLEELEKTTKRREEDDTMLDSNLCARIFDALKNNIAFDREVEFVDVIENDRRIDIFDDILLEYFRKDVRDRADNLDMNIIQAIALENSLQTRCKNREMQSEKDKVFMSVSHDDNIRYIQKTVNMAQRLAAPGIQRMSFSESREIHLVAYSDSLNDMREYRIDEFMPEKSDGAAVKTISRYEMHFFNALYNLTPDNISKFSYPKKTETGQKDAGLYHKAYVEYSKNLGADPSKNLLLTTHIDKRWENIAFLPEIDFEYHNIRVRRIQQAMIYSLLSGSLNYRYPSVVKGSKRVYVYENSDEQIINLVVSNGTPCDQFFEVLDAFYMNAALVEDVEKVKKQRIMRDANRNANYNDTTFYRDLSEFTLENKHEGIASLFEIPVFYRDSLPNSLRDQAEFVRLIDSIIDMIRVEIFTWEKEDDAIVILRDQLMKQFELFIINYNNYYVKEVEENIKPKDDLLVEVMYRKIRSVISDEPEADNLDEMLEKLKALINGR